MADPTVNIQPVLLGHLHLVVTQSAPLQLQPLQIERALEQLLQAPHTIRNRPVSWQYWHAPRDGSTFVAWQATNQLRTDFASDGYVWSGPEQVFSRDLRGCTLQIFVAESGFVPGVEQLTLHRRTRYRLVSSPNGSHDPALELVHYTASFPEHQIPSRAISLTPQISKSMQERSFLEKQGGLPRKDFMFNDRSNYPTITLPSNQLPRNPYQPAVSMYGRSGVPRGPQPPGNRPGTGPVAAKRPSTAAQRMPGANPFPASQAVPETLADEENHFYGDQLDFLSPREISTTRYKQHHEWMEEILSSPYGTTQILPVNLGLRLEGELGQLTDGLWEDGKERDAKALAKSGYDGGLNKENIAEFEKRVEEFVKKGEEQLAEMKRVHQAKMEEMSKQKLFSDLERRLLEKSGNEGVEQVTKDAEAATGLTVVGREQAKLIQRGGFMEKGTENAYEAPQPADEFADFTNMDMDTAGEALDFYDTLL